MGHATLNVVIALTIEVIIIPLMGIHNVACVSLALSVTVINLAAMTFSVVILH